MKSPGEDIMEENEMQGTIAELQIIESMPNDTDALWRQRLATGVMRVVAIEEIPEIERSAPWCAVRVTLKGEHGSEYRKCVPTYEAQRLTIGEEFSGDLRPHERPLVLVRAETVAVAVA
jgi:hypothetical protein